MPSGADIAKSVGGFFNLDDFKLGESRTFTIVKVGEEGVGAEKELKIVVRFADEKKGLVVNATRATQLRGIFGDQEAVGQKVRVVKTEAKVRNKPMLMLCFERAE